jgi:hypothetical protein
VGRRTYVSTFHHVSVYADNSLITPQSMFVRNVVISMRQRGHGSKALSRHFHHPFSLCRLPPHLRVPNLFHQQVPVKSEPACHLSVLRKATVLMFLRIYQVHYEAIRREVACRWTLTHNTHMFEIVCLSHILIFDTVWQTVSLFANVLRWLPLPLTRSI